MSRKTFAIFISVIAAVIMAMAGIAAAKENERTWDSEHPMANAGISWSQTFHGGSWCGSR